MKKFALALVSAVLLASPAAASLVRVEVTGSATGRFFYADSLNATGPVPGSVSFGGGFIDFLDLPPGVVPSDLLETVTSSTGSFLYSPSDSPFDLSFSECSGLLKAVCSFSRVVGPNPPIFDVLLNTFSMNISTCCSGFNMSPTSFSYGDDRHASFTIGDVTYSRADPIINGTFDSMSVTVVPGPAALPLLFSALGAFAFLRRRRT
jgi:hypothetical protein